MKVLIVDDEEMIRNVLKEYVEFEGNQAFEAADGMEAVRLCRENDYDIILMDVMMPRLDGFSAVKEIKKIKDIPVIMLSARGEEYDKLFGFEIGVDDYVTKPFSPKEVMARINVVTKRRNQKDETGDVVVANIIAVAILQLAGPARACIADGGVFISSGIAVERRAEVEAALAAAGYEILDAPVKGEWAAFAARKR